ncbi:MAG TPA: hypothetical protein VMB26_12400 [Candidatus Binataceae bacterium]|nr:hypothetical protein [Candidatus Binataceae bacterium]
MSTLMDFFCGRLARRTLLSRLLPLIFVCYFGTLAAAVWLYPGSYNWENKSISQLLYPRNNPKFHLVPAFGVATAGFLMIPFAGYISRRLRESSRIPSAVGGCAFVAGAVLLTLAGLILSHPARGVSAFPRLHDILARACACSLGAGMLAFYIGLLRTRCVRSTAGALTVAWTILIVPALVVSFLRLAAATRFRWSNPLYLAVRSPALWHLGFWEWIGSEAIFLFLLSAAVWLPEQY